MTKFLDAPSHIYKRVCLSIRPSVGRSVHPPFYFEHGEKKQKMNKKFNKSMKNE